MLRDQAFNLMTGIETECMPDIARFIENDI